MEDIKIDLTVLREYVHDELFYRECSINFIDVLTTGNIQTLHALFSNNGSDYDVNIRSTDLLDGVLNIEVIVTKFIEEDQLPPLKSLNNHDRITVFKYIKDRSVIKDPFDIESYPRDGLSLRLEHIARFEIKCEQQNHLEQAVELVDQIFEKSKI